MDLKDYVKVLRERWLLITIVALLGVLGAVALTALSTPQYQSTARLFVSTPEAETGQAFQGGQFSQQRVRSYATLLTGEEVSRRVVDQLGIDEDPRSLTGQISAVAELDTVILSVSATDDSPARAQQLAQTTVEVFVDYVQELETPPGRESALVKATIVDRATLPSSPVSPQPARDIAIGLLLGLLLGVGFAVLREALDNRVKSVADIQHVLGDSVPLLGDIGYNKSVVKHPLISGLPSHHPRLESYRVLRTNLEFLDPDLDHKVYVVSSALPGEGKTTTCVNLALTLANDGQRVLLIEADLRRPRAADYLSLLSTVGVTTVLLGELTLADAVQSPYDNLDFLGAGAIPPNPAELLGSPGMQKLLAEARSNYDIVLIDAPPLLPVTDAALLAVESDGVLIVVKHHSTTHDQLRSSIERLKSVNARVGGTIVTMTPPPSKRKGAAGYGYGYGYGYAPDVDAKGKPRKFGSRKS